MKKRQFDRKRSLQKTINKDSYVNLIMHNGQMRSLIRKATDGTRTHDPTLTKRLLYQLSHGGD